MDWLIAFGPVLAAALLGGGSAGLLGVLVVGLRLPFLTVCTAHAALAGAILGQLAGLSTPLCAFAAAGLCAGLLAWMVRRGRVEANAALASLFSLMLGLAFLGLALAPGPRSEMLGLLWGSPVFATWGDAWLTAGAGLALALFAWVLRRELQLLLFSRELAASILPEGRLLGGLLILGAGVITVNLETVGGLLVYSLIANPGLAALRFARSFSAALAWGLALGAFSAVAGLLAAYVFDVPSGCCVVLISSLVAGYALCHRDGGA